MLSCRVVDPVAFVEERLNMKSQQRIELNEIENKLDLEHSADLDQLRKNLSKQGMGELEQGKARLEKVLTDKGELLFHRLDFLNFICWVVLIY